MTIVICQNCTHWSPKKSPEMARLGFAYCEAIGRKYETFSGVYPRECATFVQAGEKVIAARRAFGERS